MAGAVQNETISAIESNSIPNGDVTFRARAVGPSKESKRDPPRTNQQAFSTCPCEAWIIARKPNKRFKNVNVPGTACLFTLTFAFN